VVEDDPNDEELTLRALRRSNIRNEVIVAHDGGGGVGKSSLAMGNFSIVKSIRSRRWYCSI